MYLEDLSVFVVLGFFYSEDIENNRLPPVEESLLRGKPWSPLKASLRTLAQLEQLV